MKFVFHIAAVLLCGASILAEGSDTTAEPPSYKLFRATEDYSYLANDEDRQYDYDWFDPIKYIPMTDDGLARLTIGGEFRPRYESSKTAIGWPMQT